MKRRIAFGLVALVAALGLAVGFLLAQGDGSLQSVLRGLAGLVAGTYGSANEVAVLSVDSKGRVTAVRNQAIQFPPSAGAAMPFDLAISAKTVTVGSDCSFSTPCVVRWLDLAQRYITPVPFQIPGTFTGTGSIRLSLSPVGAVTATVASITGVTCTGGCTVVSGSVFPGGEIPLWTVQVMAGNAIGPAEDYRGFLSASPVDAGMGLTKTSLPGRTILSLDRIAMKVWKTCTNVATCTILGTAHGVGSANVNVQCYTVAAGPRRRMIAPLDIYVDEVSFDVEVQMDAPRTFTCSVF